MQFRGLTVLLLAALALAVPTSAAASVRLVGVTSPVRPGADATLTVRVTQARSCAITVLYKSGPSRAQGLVPKRPVGGKVSWTWMVGTRTTPGRWQIVVSCGTAGTRRTSFLVVK